ncbi:MAG: putative hydrolase of the superfamily [Dehalococcoidia bacterium]|nr:putative hydrolase of the superfamily [Dehalococcoidia bacterium]
MIRAVFFDFYNTLARFHPPREELQAVACGQFGIRTSPRNITRGYFLADAFMAREVARLPLRERAPRDRRDFFAQYQRLILQGAGVQVSLNTAAEIFDRLGQISYDYALFEDVSPTLDALKGKGLKLGLISNIGGDMEKVCENLGLAKYLDFVITSQDVSSEKPHPAIFLEALRRAQVEPQEAMHVGDQYESDVKGAMAVGIHPVLLDRDGMSTRVQECPRIEGLMELLELVRMTSEVEVP